jgi:PPK2 family polyphosphate:nucleotide phosphotransferase
MKNATARMKPGKLASRYRITHGRRFSLAKFDPADTGSLRGDDKQAAEEILASGKEAMAAFQEMLYAQDRWSVLLVFQAMDAAGKDSAIKQVMSGVNPQGCQVYSFKAPSSEELDHDWLWRCWRALPERGRIGIFNRSYYEEVLVVKVHPAILAAQRLPTELVTDRLWDQRYEDIRAFERYLARNGTLILKFFLHVSKGEQRRRFLQRIDNPAKNWKFSEDDVRERSRWKDYMAAYEEAVRETAAPHAPWYVVPADNKWYTRLVVADAIVDALRSLELAFPRLDQGKLRDLAAARRMLVGGNNLK